jgi:hypothetical protein
VQPTLPDESRARGYSVAIRAKVPTNAINWRNRYHNNFNGLIGAPDTIRSKPAIGVPSAYVPELSRRARGVPVWAMIRALGRSGVRDLFEGCCMLAWSFAERLATEPGIRVPHEAWINQFVVVFGDGDASARKSLTEAVIARVRSEGTCFTGAPTGEATG